MTRTRTFCTLAACLSGLFSVAVPATGASAAASPPSVVGVSPAAGRTTGGNTVAIEGRGMAAATAVYFASTHATHLQHVSSTRLTVRVPRHVHGTVHVRVLGPGGRSAETNGDRYQYVVHAPSLRWSGRQSIDPEGGQLTSVSCPTTTFCAATGQNDQEHVYRDGSWSTVTLPAARHDPNAVQLSPQIVDSVSCTSPTFCVAARGIDGPIYTYDGTRWSRGPRIGLLGVSCTSPTFCLGTGYQPRIAYTFDGTRWTPTGDTGTAKLPSVACSSPTRCVAATDLDGLEGTDEVIDAVSFDGTRWTRHNWHHAHNASVSCPRGGSFCVLVDRYGRVRRYDGSMHNLATDASDAYVTSLSCADITSCVAVLGDGTTERYDPTTNTWSAPVEYNEHQSASGSYDEASAVSCATQSACTAVDVFGYAFRGSDTHWTEQLVEQHTGFLLDASCPSGTSCTAVDAAANSLTYNGRAWSRPVNVAALSTLYRVSCPTANFCAALGAPEESGSAADYTYDAVLKIDGRWQASATTISVGDPVLDLSCSSARLCMATTDSGRAIAYRNGSWQGPQQVDAPARSLESVSCPSDDFCLTGDDLGHEVTFDGRSWSAPAATGAHGNAFFSISCPNEYLCVTGSDVIRIRRNGVWGDAGVSGFGDGEYSCPSTTFCLDLAGSFNSPRNYTFNGAAVVNSGLQLANPHVECGTPTFCLSFEGPYVETGR